MDDGIPAGSRQITHRPVLSHETGRSESLIDRIAVEEPLEIRIAWEDSGKQQDAAIAVTMRTPGSDVALASGFLLTEGIVDHPEDLELDSSPAPPNVVRLRLRQGVRFEADRIRRNFYVSSSCGVCGKASLEALWATGCRRLEFKKAPFHGSLFTLLPSRMLDAQAAFEETGGLHAAALFSRDGDLLALHEDVGRHNAVDKLIGAAALSGSLPLDDQLLMVSGRTSFEILQKSLRAGIPVLAAVGAPSSLAIDVAQQFGITLVGFVRKERFNIYTIPERIDLEK